MVMRCKRLDSDDSRESLEHIRSGEKKKSIIPGLRRD
jgi:hypothetical protein